MRRANKEVSMRPRRLWAPVAAVSVVALTHLLGRLIVYLYVFDPVFSGGEARPMPSLEEASAFGNFVGLWAMPAAFLGLTALASFALARAAIIPRSRDGAIVGLVAAVGHQVVGLYFSSSDPSEGATFFVLGFASGLLGAAGGKRTLDDQEVLHEASREVAAARGPREIVSAVGKRLAGPDVVGVVLYGAVHRGEGANGEFLSLASWHSPILRGPTGERIGELLLGAAMRASKGGVPTVVHADGRGCQSSPRRPRNRPGERRYAPAAGEAGSGRAKSVKKRFTADSSPSIFTSPERNASSSGSPS